MRLEIGKKYVNRSGEVVEIVGESGYESFPFYCKDDNDFSSSGSYYHEESLLDLISEYTEPTLNRMPDSASDGWFKGVRLIKAEARIKELEAELNSLKTKSVTVSSWKNDYLYLENNKCSSSRAAADKRAVRGRTSVTRTDTTTHPDGSVTITTHKERI